MRVISGSCKGKFLKAVPGKLTRPTTDKVKEAMFNIIGPYFNGGVALDLFSGTGSLGIEALSRGIDRCIFVDMDYKAIKTIQDNLDACQLNDYSEVYRNKAERALKAVSKRDLTFQLIFLDPPYKKQKLIALIKIIADHRLLNDQGYIIAEHSSDIELPNKIANFTKVKSEKYGTTVVTLFQHNHNREE
ncbi:16S rRNA (guanine(966)-N(2))-methyltransferase RsmD [Bacillus carboniphilus]|uniref:16S rRNA (Guanine(966)-N(2))-methyltransferase RsmD n=1 Tax=Bacillus carboniphilus TaxID=86663 RepID=A0ABY9JXZ5_9BACI|nr:16S rRNA (guanine(966)-N(2))-methyltransferase RsmD [Bacillus carboniphilus]WLR43643.1 16S rRNA (guanine(966)-N(2))-methyltransferase RsmD [Bacillus carboniphilus]